MSLDLNPQKYGKRYKQALEGLWVIKQYDCFPKPILTKEWLSRNLAGTQS